MPTQWSDSILVIELADEPAFSEEVASVIDRLSADGGKPPHIVLNFAGVRYVNSTNLAQLLKLRKVLGEGGRQLRLCSVCDDVWQVMMVTGLDKVFRFAPDPMTALAGLQIDEAGKGS